MSNALYTGWMYLCKANVDLATLRLEGTLCNSFDKRVLDDLQPNTVVVTLSMPLSNEIDIDKYVPMKKYKLTLEEID